MGVLLVISMGKRVGSGGLILGLTLQSSECLRRSYALWLAGCTPYEVLSRLNFLGSQQECFADTGLNSEDQHDWRVIGDFDNHLTDPDSWTQHWGVTQRTRWSVLCLISFLIRGRRRTTGLVLCFPWQWEYIRFPRSDKLLSQNGLLPRKRGHLLCYPLNEKQA